MQTLWLRFEKKNRAAHFQNKKLQGCYNIWLFKMKQSVFAHIGEHCTRVNKELFMFWRQKHLLGWRSKSWLCTLASENQPHGFGMEYVIYWIMQHACCPSLITHTELWMKYRCNDITSEKWGICFSLFASQVEMRMWGHSGLNIWYLSNSFFKQLECESCKHTSLSFVD